MGTLVTRTEIQPKASWYFSDAYFSSDTRDYRYDWPSKNFPYCISIHDDDLTSPIKVEIRRWIETRITETVIYDSTVKSYRHYWDEKIVIIILMYVTYGGHFTLNQKKVQ